MINYDTVIAFLAENAADRELTSDFRAAYHTFQQTGRWPTPYEVYITGWQHPEGVMILAPSARVGVDYRVHLVATTERGLRELLHAFPRHTTGVFHLPERHPEKRSKESLERRLDAVLAGVPIQTDAGRLYSGVKRGSARPEQRTLSKRKDPLLTGIRTLATAKGQRERSQFIIEGERIVGRAIADGLPIEQVVCTSGFVATAAGHALLTRAATEHLSIYQVTEGVMGSLTTTRPVPAVLATVHRSYPALLSDSGALTLHFSPRCVLLIAENISNPDNLGMTVRTADAAGVSALLLSGGASPFHKNCIRAARGAIGRIPLFQTPDIVPALKALRAAGWHVLGGTAGAETDLYATPIPHPTAVIIGNENTGLSDAAREHCTELVRIPMASGQSSLNVGVAAGVLLYELRRQTGI